MRVSSCCIVVVFVSAAKTADSFIIPVRPLAVKGSTKLRSTTTTSTSLFAGLASTDAYLSSLSEVAKSRTLSSTEEYLKSLAQFVDYTASTAASWEQQQQYATETSSFAYADASVADTSLVGETANGFFQTQMNMESSSLGTSSLSIDALPVAVPVEVSMPEAGVGGIADIDSGSDSLSSSLLKELSGLSYNSLKDGGPTTSSKATKTISEFSSAASAKFDGVTNQLSKTSYDSLVFDSPTSKAAQKVDMSLVVESPTSEAAQKVDMSSFVDLGQVSEFSSKASASVSSKASASMDAVTTRIAKTLTATNDFSAAQIDKLFESLETEKMKLVEKGTEAVHGAGELQISELGKSMIGALQTVGTLFLDVLNAIAEAVSGSTLVELVGYAQASANNLVDGAIKEVTGAIHHIGEMSFMQVAQILVTITVTVMTTVWKILNAVVQVVSGKTMSDWALVAAGSVEHEASKLSAKAIAVATDVSEKSLSELVGMTTSFLHDTTTLFAQGLHSINEYVEGSGALEGASVAVSESVGGMSESISTLVSSL